MSLNPALPDWMARLFAPFMPQVPPFEPLIPQFDTVELVSTKAGTMILPNTNYYVTQDTALKLMARFRAQRIEERAAPARSPDGGVITIAGDPGDVGKPAIERYLIFPAGSFMKDAYGNTVGSNSQQIEIEAGLLADYFVRMPETQLPPQALIIGWPPQSVTALSAAERDAWSALRRLAGFAN